MHNKIKGATLLLITVTLLASCKTQPKKQVDALFINAKVYTVNDAFEIVEALAIDSGKIVAVGSTNELMKMYTSAHIYDLESKPIYPGFIDAHSHFTGYGKNKQELNLKDVTSLEDMFNRTVAYAQSTNPSYIMGRGWNEEDWAIKGSITNFKLNLLFPEIPVVLQRVDGHAVLCNQAALKLANIDATTQIDGGHIDKMGNMLTGLLVDNAASAVLDALPELSRAQRVKALLDAQQSCYKAGLTTVCDAGLDEQTIRVMDSLYQTGDLTIGLYVMSNPDSNAVLRILATESITNNERLSMRSIKLYADGALGSRGALLKAPYCDDSTTYGLIQQPIAYFKAYIDFCKRNNLQVNTHCIGDSANSILLRLYAEQLNGKNDLRWRIEHAQVVDPSDISLFQNNSIIPSIQPTHATSDAAMAHKRLCESSSMAGAYIYRQLLERCGIVALGTDFPVEAIDPLDTYFAAVKRKAKSGEIFKPEEALDPRDALRGMTIWAAYANFQDGELGSLEVGKTADLTILSNDLIGAASKQGIRNEMTWSQGQKVYDSGRIKPLKD